MVLEDRDGADCPDLELLLQLRASHPCCSLHLEAEPEEERLSQHHPGEVVDAAAFLHELPPGLVPSEREEHLERAPILGVAHAPHLDELAEGRQQPHSVPLGRSGGGAAAADADVAEGGLEEDLRLPAGLVAVEELGDDGGEERERLGGARRGGGEGGEELEQGAEVVGAVVEVERGEEPDGLERRVRVGAEDAREDAVEVGEVGGAGRRGGGDGGEEARGGVAEERLEAGEAEGRAHGGEVHHDGAGGHGAAGGIGSNRGGGVTKP